MGIILAILLFSGIIIFHELGHFTLAKLNGIRVEEFSLGLGPTIIGKEFHGTKFCLKLLPFGGACMMGEDDVDDMSEGSFNSKSVWARISVILAGPVFNIIMALAFSIIMVGWIGYDSTVVKSVDSGYSAAEQGIQAGDEITGINGKSVHLWKEINLYRVMNKDEDSVEIKYERDGKEHTANVEMRKLGEDTYKRLGISGSAENTRAGFFKSIQYGAYTLRYWVDYTVDCLKMFVTGQVGVKDLSGPVGIVHVVDDTYKAAAPEGMKVVILNLLNFAILLSANLGVINMLPIPALDGGRFVFLLIEAVRKKRVPPEKEGMVHFAGFAALMILMVVVMFNDIRQLF